MELSIFLAKFFGVYFLLMTLLWVIRKEQMVRGTQDILASRGCFALSGILALLFGIAIAVGHPIWEFSWRGAITLMGYIGIAKGFFRLAFPEKGREFDTKIISGSGYWWVVCFLGLLGLFFLYFGFGLTGKI